MRIVITGTSTGIGEATARKFLSEGHEVFGLDINPSSISDDNYIHYICDVSDETTLPDITEVNILVNNAGIQLGNTDDEVMQVNFNGVRNCTCKYVLRQVVFGHIRSIVNVADAGAHTGSEFPIYCASKGAVISYTKTIAKIIAPYGATCNSISPGGVITPVNAPLMNDISMMDAALKETPLGKWASSQEIADWIYFIAVINKSMTAQDVIIDNGEMHNHTFFWPGQISYM